MRNFYNINWIQLFKFEVAVTVLTLNSTNVHIDSYALLCSQKRAFQLLNLQVTQTRNLKIKYDNCNMTISIWFLHIWKIKTKIEFLLWVNTCDSLEEYILSVSLLPSLL